MNMIFDSADGDRRAFHLFRNSTQIRMQRLKGAFVPEEWPALLGGEDCVNVNG
jgi:hypothetical protein